MKTQKQYKTTYTKYKKYILESNNKTLRYINMNTAKLDERLKKQNYIMFFTVWGQTCCDIHSISECSFDFITWEQFIGEYYDHHNLEYRMFAYNKRNKHMLVMRKNKKIVPLMLCRKIPRQYNKLIELKNFDEITDQMKDVVNKQLKYYDFKFEWNI